MKLSQLQSRINIMSISFNSMKGTSVFLVIIQKAMKKIPFLNFPNPFYPHLLIFHKIGIDLKKVNYE